MAEVVVDLEQETLTNTGDHDLFSHYADANDITYSMVNGTPIMALCGKIWIPSRDPKKFPVCVDCYSIYHDMFWHHSH
jgi:hypothetical protein